MKPTYITKAAARTLDTALVTEPERSRHIRQIVTPARTGGRIGHNRKRGMSMGAALALMAGIAITLAIAASILIQP